MKYKRLGHSGLQITELTFGTALTIGTENNGESYAKSLINKAWDLGIRSFDTSNNYGLGEAERLTGIALKDFPRHEYVLSTKGSWPIGGTPYHKGLSRKHILWAFEESMRKLGVDYVDIYYAHRYDQNVPMTEIVRTFNYLINTGRIRYWATSEWPLDSIRECLRVCDQLGMERPIVEQFIYSYAVNKAEVGGVKNFCDQNGIGTMGFSPLCQGYLTGKYRNDVPADSRIAKSEQLNYDKTINFYNQFGGRIDHFLKTCDKYGADYTAAALQWSIRRSIYPVFGASKPQQIESNVASIEIYMDDNMWRELESL